MTLRLPALLSLAAVSAWFALPACGSGGGGPADAKTDSGADATPDATSSCAVGEFRCSGDLLETCAENGKGFQPVATCKAGLCDARGKQCDTCAADEGKCNGDGASYTACDASGQKLETTTCSAPTPFCKEKSGKPACVGCKAATDCPATSSDCQLAACSADGTCGVSSVAKDTPCGAVGAGGKCDGSGACVYCTAREKRCTGSRPRAATARVNGSPARRARARSPSVSRAPACSAAPRRTARPPATTA